MAAFLVRATQVKYKQSPEGFVCMGFVDCSTTTPYFNDVPSTDIFFKYVQKLKQMNITAVAGNYNPTETVSRDQMAAFISRAFLGME